MSRHVLWFFVPLLFANALCLAQPVVTVGPTTYSSFASVAGLPNANSNTATPATVAGSNGAATGGTEHSLEIPAQQKATATSTSLAGGWPNNRLLAAFSWGNQDILLQVAMPNQKIQWESVLDTNNEEIMLSPTTVASYEIQGCDGNLCGLRTTASRSFNSNGNLVWVILVETKGQAGNWQPFRVNGQAIAFSIPNALAGRTLFISPDNLNENFQVGDRVRIHSSVDLVNAIGPFEPLNPAILQQESIFQIQ